MGLADDARQLRKQRDREQAEAAEKKQQIERSQRAAANDAATQQRRLIMEFIAAVRGAGIRPASHRYEAVAVEGPSRAVRGWSLNGCRGCRRSLYSDGCHWVVTSEGTVVYMVDQKGRDILFKAAIKDSALPVTGLEQKLLDALADLLP